MPVLHSTKNLQIIEPPTATETGIGLFEYTDNYTVFHYGRMPDLIPGKGEACARMAAFNFTMLEEAGIRTHFRRFIEPNQIEFDLARLPDPATPDSGNYLIPVQVLFRNELPQGSSVHRRLAAGDLAPAHVGLTNTPAVGATLKQPIIEYATMLEDINRYIDEPEAQHLIGLSNEQFRTMRETTLTVNEILTRHAREVGLHHADGKIEFLVDDDTSLVLADSPGTPDESRIMFNDVHCGKQILRNWYVNHGHEIPVSKLITDGVPRNQWPQPVPLPPEFLPVMSDLYRSLAETWTSQRRWNAPNLPTATHAVTELISQ